MLCCESVWQTSFRYWFSLLIRWLVPTLNYVQRSKILQRENIQTDRRGCFARTLTTPLQTTPRSDSSNYIQKGTVQQMIYPDSSQSSGQVILILFMNLEAQIWRQVSALPVVYHTLFHVENVSFAALCQAGERPWGWRKSLLNNFGRHYLLTMKRLKKKRSL